MFCFAPVIFSGARFGPQFDYSCIKGGTKFGSHFWLPFSVFSRSTFIKKSECKTHFHNQIIAVRYCTSRLYVCAAYITAIGYGVDEAVWINVVETPIPYHVGGRRGWKKPPRTRIQISNGWESIFASTFCQTPMGGWIQKSSKVLGLATGRNRTLTYTQSCACNALPPQSLLIENICIGTAMEMESFAYP